MRQNYSTLTSSVTMSKYGRHKFWISWRARYKSRIRAGQVVEELRRLRRGERELAKEKFDRGARSLGVGQERRDGEIQVIHNSNRST